MEHLFFIALLGIFVGVISNLFPLLGSTLLNFLAAVLLSGYQTLAENIPQFPLIPFPIMIFAIAYFVGTFAVKIFAIIPTPLQPFFIGLRGTL